MPSYLMRQKETWYAVLEVPEDLQPLLNKRRLKRTLKTHSKKEASVRVLPVVAEWKRLINTVREDGGLGLQVEKVRELITESRRAGLSEEDIHDAALTSLDVGKEYFAYELATGRVVVLQDQIEPFFHARAFTQKTEDMFRKDLSDFVAKFPYADTVNKKAVRDWVKKDLIADRQLSHSTRGRIITALSSFWTYLQERELVEEGVEPFNGVNPKQKATSTNKPLQRQAIRKEDYKKLLAASEQDSDLKNLIVLGAYTGCRIEELCSLRVEDVLEGRLVVKGAKTNSGNREVPIHSHIEDLVASLKESSQDGYLLSGLTENKYGDRSNAIGKRFGRMKGKAGFGPEIVFHSLRKGFSTQLEEALVPEIIAARIVGHKVTTMTYGVYSGGAGHEIVKEAVEKVSWR